MWIYFINPCAYSMRCGGKMLFCDVNLTQTGYLCSVPSEPRVAHNIKPHILRLSHRSYSKFAGAGRAECPHERLCACHTSVHVSAWRVYLVAWRGRQKGCVGKCVCSGGGGVLCAFCRGYYAVGFGAVDCCRHERTRIPIIENATHVICE